MATIHSGKDLTKEPPRSPRVRVGGYVILGRTIDKCRALLWGNVGEYHFDCPLDNQLFDFVGIKGDEFKQKVESGATDEEIARWLDEKGGRVAPEKKLWSDDTEKHNPYFNPERREWFIEKTQPLGLDPEKTTLFDWLEADDRASYAQAA